MDETIKSITYASQQSDRWAFFCSLVVLGFVLWLVLRYLLKQNTNLINDHQRARDQYHDSLQKIVADQNAASREVAIVIDRNTQALNANTSMLHECTEALKHIQR